MQTMPMIPPLGMCRRGVKVEKGMKEHHGYVHLTEDDMTEHHGDVHSHEDELEKTRRTISEEDEEKLMEHERMVFNKMIRLLVLI